MDTINLDNHRGPVPAVVDDVRNADKPTHSRKPLSDASEKVLGLSHVDVIEHTHDSAHAEAVKGTAHVARARRGGSTMHD